MGRIRRLVALAIAAAAGTSLVAVALGSGGAATQVDPASRAIEYLEAQQSGTDGSIPVGPSTAAVSEEYAIAAAAAGYDPSALRHGDGPSVMTYLAAHAASACATAGGCGELIQAVVAAGLDPTAFGGLDLVTTLDAFYDGTTGAFGVQGSFTQALAVQGLVAAGRPVPAAAITLLVDAQDSDGGWDYLLVKDDPDGAANFDTSDTNSTAMVLMALDATATHQRDATALAWLHTQQDGDGGFPYQAGAGTDPDSTALVLQALLAANQNPDAPGWAAGGHTPLGELIATQDQDGGYTFPGNPAPDPFTTAEVPIALDLQPYPAHGVFASGTTPASEASAATHAIEYLEAQQSGTDGSIPVGPSTAAVSEEYAIAAAAAGYDPSALRHGDGPSVMTYLAAHAASACATAGGCGELIQAVVAAGLDPTAFGGLDLVTTLDAFYDGTTGAFGVQGSFTQALAVQGLVAAGRPVPAAAITLLVDAQDSDGGWDYLLVKDDPDGAANFDTSDTNSTAMVLMALDATATHQRDATALAWLHTQQDGDGGFPYQAGAGTDPDSTALVLQALLAANQNPDAPGWAAGGHTPLGELIATQDQDGGYTFPGNPAPDPFTTAEVPIALDRATYPLACGTARCFEPGASLTGPSPTATPRSTPTARPTRAGGPAAPPPPPASPTAAVAAATATPTPAPAPPAGTPRPAGGGSAGIPATPLAPPAGFPAAAIYVLAAAGAAVIAAGIALGVHRMRGT